jgi:hypothetical protein
VAAAVAAVDQVLVQTKTPLKVILTATNRLGSGNMSLIRILARQVLEGGLSLLNKRN